LVGEPLTITRFSRIYRDGGSILFTSRANPQKPNIWNGARKNWWMRGSTTSCPSAATTRLFRLQHCPVREGQMGVPMQVVHAPRPLTTIAPAGRHPHFGFETAREVGTRLVMNCWKMRGPAGAGIWPWRWDAAPGTWRWASAKAPAPPSPSSRRMARRKVRLQEVLDILAGSVIKRLADDKKDGVAVIAEGLMEHMEEEDMKQLSDDIPLDDHGHIRMPKSTSQKASRIN
jgi:6-phosphofructokinase 1